MTEDDMRAASELLCRHWRDETRIDALPPPLRPADRAEGYRVQAFIEAHTAHPLFGWKIAATSVAGQKHINVDGPIAGRLLAERVIADGGDFALGGSFMRLAEMEFAFRMARDFAPRPAPCSLDEVMAGVASLHPAIELPDTRFTDVTAAGVAQLVADNACAHKFVLGPASVIDWRDLDLAAHPVQALIDGALVGEGVGANVLGDPRIALTWLVNELLRHGMTLRAGEVVTTGTCVKPVPIAPGDQVRGDFGPLGTVAVVAVV